MQNHLGTGAIVSAAVQAGVRMQKTYIRAIQRFIQKASEDYSLHDLFFKDDTPKYPERILRKKDIDAIKIGKVKRLMVI